MSQATPSLPFKVRVAIPDDHRYVLNSWKAGLREYHDVGNFEYYAVQNPLCDAILAGDNVILLVAHPPEYEHVILGWCCAEATEQGFVLWMANTKGPYRRQGIARKLLEVAQDIATREGAGPRKVFVNQTRFDFKLVEKGFEHVKVAKVQHWRAG